MKAKWIIEDFVADNCYQDLIDEVKKQGHECCVIKYFPFQSGNYDKVCQDRDCVVFQGSINLVEQLQKEKPNWVPGVIATWENYECHNYYPPISQHLFNRNYGMYTVEQLLPDKWDIFRCYGEDATIWIRPSSGKKSFTARTVDLEEYDKFINTWVIPYTKSDDKIVISTPKKVNGEWRFICSKDKGILGQSCYMYQGNRIYVPSAPNGAIQKCEDVLWEMNYKTYWPDPFFALDIVEDIEGNFSLMELNAFSSCGLYKANKETIVSEVSSYAELSYQSLTNLPQG